MEEAYKRLQNATVQIFVGDQRRSGNGSGFHFRNENTIVTNAHVVEPILNQKQSESSAYAVTSEGDESELDLIAANYNETTGEDYAIFEAQDEFNKEREILKPLLDDPRLGTEVLFAGFPHGVKHNLVSRAYVSGYFGGGFYLDGAINSGNSGGPAIDIESGKVYGIVTAKRYISAPHLKHLKSQWQQLQERNSQGGVAIDGINVTASYSLLAESMKVLNHMLKANASTGIGRVQPIDWVLGTLIDREL